nr:phage tail tape measure protein [Acetomicrobium sp. S15 = DSM 107314]
MLGAAALVGTLAAPVYAAMKTQEAEIKLSTVINADDKEKAMKEARSVAEQMAKSGLTGLEEGYNIQYALNSAGLDAEAARTAALVVAKVAKVTAGVPEQVGEVIATTYNNLGNQLSGNTQEKMSRLGDLLTKVQFKYQIRDFGQLGESLKEGAAGMANYNVNLEQGVMLLGQLNSAGLQGSQAGTALNAVLRQMSKAQEAWGIEIQRNDDGQLDMIATLREIESALEGLDFDERAQEIQKVFGDEGAKGIVPLLNKLNELPGALNDVSEGSRGLVDEEVKKFLKSAKAQLDALQGSVVVLASSLGRVLLPGIASVAGSVAKGVSAIADLTERFPKITKVIVGAVSALALMKVGMIGLGYGWTFVKGGFLAATGIFYNLRAALLLATGGQKALVAAQLEGTAAAKAVTRAQMLWNKVVGMFNVTKHAIAIGLLRAKTLAMAAAQKIAAAAQWAFNAAMSANPIGLVIASIAALIVIGVVLYKKWDVVSVRIAGAWDWIKEKASSVVGWFGGIPEMIANALAGVGEIIWGPFKGALDKIAGFPDKIKGIWQGIKNVITGNSDVEKVNGSPRYQSGTKPSKHGRFARGGVVSNPTLGIFGEAGKEYLIPVTSPNDKLGRELWAAAGQDLGILDLAREGFLTNSMSATNRNEIRVSYSPTIQVTTSGNPQEMAVVIDKTLKDDLDAFMAKLQQALNQERRLALE